MFNVIMREGRKSQRIVFRELARRTGIAPSRLSEIEDGRALPDDTEKTTIMGSLGKNWDPLGEDLHMEEFLAGLKRIQSIDMLYGMLDTEVDGMNRIEITTPILARIKKVESLLPGMQTNAVPISEYDA